MVNNTKRSNVASFIELKFGVVRAERRKLKIRNDEKKFEHN